MIATPQLRLAAALCFCVCLLAGCGGNHRPLDRNQVLSELRNLRWDAASIEDDLLVARLDLGEQRRRVRQALTDLQQLRHAPPLLRASAADLVSADARHAADGVAAVKNDAARIAAGLAYLTRDLAGLNRELRTRAPGPRTAGDLSRGLVFGRREGARIRSETAFIVAEATRLRALIAGYAHEARATAVRSAARAVRSGALHPDRVS